jgi:hypothetical protein
MPQPARPTFFVVTDTGLTREPGRIDSPAYNGSDAEYFLDFAADAFPLRLVSVVGLQVRSLPFTPYDRWHPWTVTVLPSGVRTQVSRSLRGCELIDPSISFDGKPLEWGSPITAGGWIEATACSYEELCVPEHAIAESPHSFLTTRPQAHYQALRCRVQLQIASWAELPRCFAADDDAHRPVVLPPEFKRTAVDDVMDAGSAYARSAYRLAARTRGPHQGSFIPCSLWYGLEKRESECVLEIAGGSQDTGHDGLLHVLTATGPCNVCEGMKLRDTTEVFNPGRTRSNTVLTDLGRIVG